MDSGTMAAVVREEHNPASGLDQTRRVERSAADTSTDWSSLPPMIPRAAPSRLGRYEILETLGAGGMGTVFRARDPELGRDVAVKVIRTGNTSEELHARLIREAQALAKLSHPNIVAVHDVGETDEQLFLAMDYIRGQTLQRWLAARPRTVREILDVFIAAGRGLAAAHAAGLVHRDFKPQNALVGDDGRPQLVDFGLARGDTTAQLTTHELAPDELEERPSALSLDLTREGHFLGTPAYMSPEQYLGEPTDARSDQFSFCVTLYEALYGQRPFAGETFTELGDALLAGVLRARPRGRRVPRWIDDVIVRGLAPSPERRWPSMDALLERLAGDPARRRRRLLGAVATIALVGGGGYMAAAAAAAPSPCADAATRLDDVWGERHAASLREVLDSSAVPYAHETWPILQPALDGYAGAWIDAFREQCVAYARGERSDTRHDLAMRCLNERRASLHAAVTLLTGGGAEAIGHAAELVGDLPPVELCADPTLLEARFLVPDDPQQAAAILRLQARITEIRVSLNAGLSADAPDPLAPLEAEVAALDHPPLSASYWLARAALIGSRTSQPVDAAEPAARALAAAIRGGDDRMASEAAATVAEAHLRDRGAQPQYIRHLLQIAQAHRARVDAPELDATLAVPEALLLSLQGDLPGSLEQLRDAVARARALPESSWVHKITLTQELAVSASRLGHYAEADAALRETLALQEPHLGPGHPGYIRTLMLRADIAIDQRALDDAFALLDDAEARAVATFGPNSPHLLDILERRLIVQDHAGDLEGALRNTDRALQLETGPFMQLSLRNSRGVLLDRLGRHDDARVELERALAAAMAEDDPVALPVIRLSLADVLLHLGEHDAARQQYALALEGINRHMSPESPLSIYARNGLGLVTLAQERWDDARAQLDEVLRLREAGEGAPDELARTRFGLARALWGGGDPTSRARALALARVAVTEYASVGRGYDRPRAEVEAWLAARAAELTSAPPARRDRAARPSGR
ncbi:MAG: protein kinase [Myxococcales bacterium]|nr:protein kinase [Myxococcales bacterium]